MAQRKTSPWLVGIVDTIVGAEILRTSMIPGRNRLAVILIDSAFETACRAFLRHRANVSLNESHRQRANLVKTVTATLSAIDSDVWESIDFYYKDVRCDFYHDSAAKTIDDVALLDYRDTVEFVIDEAFACDIRALVGAELARLKDAEKEREPGAGGAEGPRVAEVEGRTPKLILAVGLLKPRDVSQVNEYFKREGESLRLKQVEFRKIVAQNSGSKKYFYYHREGKVWCLSELGLARMAEIGKGVSSGE